MGAVIGPPGCKTTRVKKLIGHVKAQGGNVLFTFRAGQMQSRLCAQLQAEGLQVDVDTCYGAFALHKKEQDALPIVNKNALTIGLGTVSSKLFHPNHFHGKEKFAKESEGWMRIKRLEENQKVGREKTGLEEKGSGKKVGKKSQQGWRKVWNDEGEGRGEGRVGKSWKHTLDKHWEQQTEKLHVLETVVICFHHGSMCKCEMDVCACIHSIQRTVVMYGRHT